MGTFSVFPRSFSYSFIEILELVLLTVRLSWVIDVGMPN